ncbi:MAG: tol-pal system-associated acyl-CoA thioesterase [Pseudomonadota bacterium]
MLPTAEFRWPVRVYYEDTDAQGIVYYANYLKFLERARTEWLRAQGVDQPALREADRLFVVTRIETDYLIPARYDDELQATVTLAERRRASFVLRQRVVASHDDTIAHCRAVVTIAFLQASSMRPARLPAHLIAES